MPKLKKVLINITGISLFLILYMIYISAYATTEKTIDNYNELVEVVRLQAIQSKVDIDKYDIEIIRDDELIVVKLDPKNKHQAGGNIDWYFKYENGNYIFVKGYRYE
jgi:hypothetical protein